MTSHPEAKHLTDIDIPSAIASMENDVDGYAAIADVFIEECPAALQALERSSMAGVASLLAVLHEVANSLEVVGAEQSGRMIRDLEIRLHEGDSVDTGLAADLAARALNKAASELKAWIASRTRH